MTEPDHPSNPLRLSQGDISLQQSSKGDRNQTIGQVLGGMVVYVSGGQAIFNSGSQEPAAKPAASTIGPNPYRGLMAFQETDGDRFFGREKQIGDLWSKLRDLHEDESAIRLLPIYGPSGSGKSSLARAGLIPELARHPIPGCDRARVAILVPGTHPLEALATVLARIATNDPIPVEKSEEFERVLKKVSDNGHYDGLRRIANALPDITISPLIVLVDQFEEIYTLCETQEERDAFVENLLCAASDRAKRVTVIVTLRSDFLGETQKHPVLNELFAEQGFLVRSMKVDELREAIAKPAELAGHPLDAATIDLLIKDTEGREGALPLLQFALTRIWEGLGEGKEPAETLKVIGGVGGALAGEAQRIYDSLGEQEKAIARRLFLGLVQLGEGTRDTRRRAVLDSLISYQNQPEQVKQVINLFSAPGVRLITLSTDGKAETAEVTHEALLDHWQKLDQWLDQSRSDLRFQRRMEEDAQYWNEQGRPDGNLWRPPDLNSLIQYQQRRGEDLTPLQVAFFNASRQAEITRQRLRKLGIGGLVAGIILTSGLAALALSQLQRAERQRVEQLTTVAKMLIASRPLDASLNAIAAAGASQSTLLRFLGYTPPTSVQDNLLSVLQGSREQNRLRHQDIVTSASFSPSSQYIVTSSTDKTAKVWDFQGNSIATLSGHQDRVTSASFSPNEQYIVTTSDDKTGRLWDLQGRSIATLDGHQGEVTNADFSPDGQYIATASYDKTARLWDSQGNSIATLNGHQDRVTSANFSPNGQYIVTSSADRTARLWDLQGNFIAIFNGHQDKVTSASFSPDGQYIITSSADLTARLWDLQGNFIGILNGHQGAITSASFNSDGQYIITASDDKTARLWDSQGNFIAILNGHQNRVTSANFSPDGQYIVTSSADRTARLWDFQPNSIAILNGHQDRVTSISFSPDSQYIVTSSADKTARLWDLQGNSIAILNGHQGTVTRASFGPDGQYIVTSSADKTARLWDLQGNSIATLSGHQDVVISVSFGPDGQYIVTSSADKTARLWDLQGNSIATLSGHQDKVNRANFSPNGQYIVTASNDTTARLWDLQGNSIATLSGHQSTVNRANFSSDGQHIVTASDDTTARLWDLQGNSIATLSGHQDVINNANFSPDGRYIVTASDDMTARLWNLQGNSISVLNGHQDRVTSANFSPDGEYIVTASADKTVQVWTLQGNSIVILNGHQDWVYGTSFSPNGQYIGSASLDKTARIWEIEELNHNTLLEKLCSRLRYHPALTQPQTDIAREAKRTCERYALKD